MEGFDLKFNDDVKDSRFRNDLLSNNSWVLETSTFLFAKTERKSQDKHKTHASSCRLVWYKD